MEIEGGREGGKTLWLVSVQYYPSLGEEGGREEGRKGGRDGGVAEEVGI